MPQFHYKAADAQGAILEGEMDARALESVAEHLQAQGFLPIHIEEAMSVNDEGWGRIQKLGEMLSAPI